MIQYNLEKLREVIVNLYTLSHIKVSIFDERMNEILYYPSMFNPYCALIRTKEEGTSVCLAADKNRLDEVREKKIAITYVCPFGLIEVFSPIVIRGMTVGYMTLGQIISEKTDREALLNGATNLGIPLRAAQAAIERTEKIPESIVVASTQLLSACAKYIYVDKFVDYLDNGTADEISNYIASHLEETLTTDVLCKRFYLSRPALYNLFHHYFGTTVAKYVRSIRIEKAKELLSTKDIQVKKVASMIGQDYNYFTKIFFEETGITPKKYQQTYAR